MENKVLDPTEKQIEYIRAIESVLGYPFDYEHSNRRDASNYITKYSKRWKAYQKDLQSKKEESA